MLKKKNWLFILFFATFSFNYAEAAKSNSKEIGENRTNMEFTPDHKIQEIAEHYAGDAVSFALKQFKITLDWSDESIKEVEFILDYMHKQALKDKPSDDEIFSFAKGFGSYIGEVYRRNHGAEWGMFTWEGESFPGLQSKQNPNNFWPWGKVQNRIKNGEEDNVQQYYHLLIEKTEVKSPS